MLYGKALHSSVFALRQFQNVRLKYVIGLVGVLALLACWYIGPSVSIALFSISFITLLFMIRIDIGFYMIVALWTTGIAVPLPIASPFDPSVRADLPVYEVLTPLLCLCLLARIAMGKERMPSSPLKMPVLVWFGFIGLTYFRNPIFLSDLMSESGTGTVYRTLYFLFLCAIFYLSASSILKTERQIILAVKIMYTMMAVGVLIITFEILTGWDLPGFTSGPWRIQIATEKGGVVFRSVGLSSYSSLLILALLYLGSHLRKPLQLIICLVLLITLVLGGGRSNLIALSVYLLLTFILQPRTRWLIACLALLMVLFILFLLPNIKLPYTTRRITNFSAGAGPGGPSITGRLQLAQIAWDIAKKRPLIGIGYARLPEYYSGAMGMKSSGATGGDMHSGFLGMMMTYGLVGLSVFLWVIFTAIRTGWRLYKNTEDGFLKQFMLLSILSFILSLLMSFAVGGLERSISAYLQIGIIASMYTISSENGRCLMRSDASQVLQISN